MINFAFKSPEKYWKIKFDQVCINLETGDCI